MFHRSRKTGVALPARPPARPPARAHDLRVCSMLVHLFSGRAKPSAQPCPVRMGYSTIKTRFRVALRTDPSVPTLMRHRPAGRLPLRATGETSTWSCPARQAQLPYPPVALKARKAAGRRWFQRHRRRRLNFLTGRAADGHSPRPIRSGSWPKSTAPGPAAAVPSCDARGSIHRLSPIGVANVMPALMKRSRRSSAAPSAGDLVLLSDARFISEPDFYTGCVYPLFPRDFVQTRGELFLYSSIAPSV